jgi:hypothetical protein
MCQVASCEVFSGSFSAWLGHNCLNMIHFVVLVLIICKFWKLCCKLDVVVNVFHVGVTVANSLMGKGLMRAISYSFA